MIMSHAILFFLIANGLPTTFASSNGTEQSEVHLVSWRWDEYSSTILFNVMIILASSFKIAFHRIPVLSDHIPESCVLIILGCLIGVLINYCFIFSEEHPFPEFTSSLFFNVLLPPVILDSAYSLYDREFISSLGSVMIFAIIGTLFNVFVVGGLLRGIFMIGAMASSVPSLSILECLIFASLISAVDPVAVLAIFEEVGVNLGLYFLVFGESLLNDGVTIVIYNTMKALDGKKENILPLDYILAFLSFFTVAGGGFFIGIIFGALSAILLKFTEQSRIIEPIVIMSNAYFSFILSETFHWSGIMALIGCGLVQKRYAFANASNKTRSTVKNGIQTLSSVSDAIIFLFLGTLVISNKHDFQITFILWTLFLCLVIRFIGVFVLSAIINTLKTKPISIREQFIMAYGGLRGAVGFSLAALISDDKVYKNMIITTTIIVIFFTVFIQGGTIKVLVNLLHIKRKEIKSETHSEIVNEKLIDQVMGGIEAITGNISKYRIISILEYIDNKFIKKFLLSSNSLINMEIKLRDITMEEHYARLYGPTVLVSENKIGVIGNEDFTYTYGLTRSYSNEYIIQPEPSTLKDNRAIRSLQRIFDNSPYELYKKRVFRRSEQFDDYIVKQLETVKQMSSRIKRKIIEEKDKKNMSTYDKIDSNGSSTDLIKSEYKNAKKIIREKNYLV